MAIYWMDGFDHYDNETQLYYVYPYSISNIASGGVYSSCLNMWSTNQLYVPIPTISSSEIYVSAHMLSTALATPNTSVGIVRIYENNSSDGIFFKLNSGYYWQVYRNSTLIETTNVFFNMPNVWQHFIFYVKKSLSSDGIIKIYKNGIEVYSYTGVTATSSASVTSNVTIQDPDYYNFKIDNLVISDTFENEIIVYPLVPVADGYYTELSRSAGTSNYENVDEVAPSDSAYNYSNLTNKRDLYLMQEASSVSANSIAGVAAALCVSKTAGDYSGLKLMLRQGTTDYTHTSTMVPSSTGNTTFLVQLLKNPITNNDWQLSEFNGSSRIQFGVVTDK